MNGPMFYPCGCSHLKVELGRCDIYDEHGRDRADVELDEDELARLYVDLGGEA